MEVLTPAISDELVKAILPDKLPSKILFTVGSVLRGDDSVGPYVAKKFSENVPSEWMVVEGDQTPENELGYIRRIHPSVVVMVDAADMGLSAGEIRRISKDDVKKSFLFTTHSMPITYLLEQLEDSCDKLIFIGVQPAQTEFFAPLTKEVKISADKICDSLLEENDLSYIPSLS